MPTVKLFSYSIVIENGALSRAADLVRAAAPAHRYAIVSDDQVGPRYAAPLRQALGADAASLYTVRAGESEKSRDSWAMLTDAMLMDGLGRDTTVVALGGGVIGDLAGFVAATYMRGIPFVQLPTSLLAMIDASVGGKTGVDTPAGKNLVGAFHQPKLVIVDPEVLATLPAPHLRAGMAEALKHGVIASEEYFRLVEPVAAAAAKTGVRGLELTPLVEGSVRIKSEIVSHDEREGGIRKTLNFGHTIGHAVEALSGYALLHGEAIAIGMVVEARIAESLGIAERGVADRIRRALVNAALPVDVPAEIRPDDILETTRSDKKARAGRVEYALPKRIGEMSSANGWSVAVGDDVVRAALG